MQSISRSDGWPPDINWKSDAGKEDPSHAAAARPFDRSMGARNRIFYENKKQEEYQKWQQA